MRPARTRSWIFVAAMVIVVLAGCQASVASDSAGAQGAGGRAGPIQVSGAWARISVAPAMTAVTSGSPAPDAHAGAMAGKAGAMPAASTASANGAAYMTIRNTGTSPDRLLAAQSGIAAAVEIHTTTNDGGVMRMSQVETVDLPAGVDVSLQSGGLHIMLIGVTSPRAAGETFELTLRFESAGDLMLRVPIREP